MTHQRLAYLDVLKAIAIIAVVLYHSGFLKYGYLGVDVFLVVSGYLITRSLEKRGWASNDGWYLPFVGSKVLRLFPVLLVAGLVAMAIGWFTMLPDDYENLSESSEATLLFGNNILSAKTTGNYWDIANDYKPLMHTWYVGLLMQLCIVYPLLFCLAKINKEAPKKTLFVIVSSLAVLSLLCYFGSSNEAHRFYYLPARFFEFAVGGIVALTYDPAKQRVFHPVFSYLCYALLLVLLVVGYDLVPTLVRLPLVVALSAMVIMSGEALSNPLTSNKVLAKIGVASYSIFVWHQVLLAFYRYIIGGQFTVWTYLLYLAIVGVVSWASYRLIEQGVSRLLDAGKRKPVYIATASVWLILGVFAGTIYWNAGVVRDVPELDVSIANRHRHMHAEYTDRGYQYDRPFVSENKAHWLVIGDSFARDFVNTILESSVAEQVEVSYTDDYFEADNQERLTDADRVFIAERFLGRRSISAIEAESWANGLTPDKIVIVGEKNFGESNGPVYAKRHRPDYFEQSVEVEGGAGFMDRNSRFREFYGDRFLDLMSLVAVGDGRVRVFTPEHRFISADCRHLTRSGARYFAGMIDWERYLN